jgi:hypothetical protein
MGCRIPQWRINKSVFLFVKFQENKLQTNNNNQFRSCARHEFRDKKMKKKRFYFLMTTMVITIMAVDICSYGQKLRPVRGLNQLWGFVDEAGKEVIPFRYKAARDFSEGLAAIKLINYWGFIDKEGTVKIPCKYENAGDFSEGLARVKLNRKWGYINNTGTPVISFIYDDARDFSGGTAHVKIKRNWIFIDKTGKEVSKNISSETITETNNTQISTNTYDVILIKDGEEIKAQVIEHKLSKKNKNCVKNTAFGLDMGLGGSFYANHNTRTRSTTSFAPALGIRVMHHFNPYFGIDFFKINWITDVFYSEMDEGWTMRLQIMPGIRGNSPAFFKCMSVYSAFRLGYGMDFRLATLSGVSHFEGLCLETELGLNLTSTVFAGFAYNCQKYFVKGTDSKVAMHTFSFRLGFNFGK